MTPVDQETFREELNERLVNSRDFVAAGRAPSFDVYQYHCGRIQGLRDALTILEDLRKKREDD
jgi:hypothetical protein